MNFAELSEIADKLEVVRVTLGFFCPLCCPGSPKMIGIILISLQVVFLAKSKETTETKDKHYRIRGLQVILIFCEKASSYTFSPV